MEELAERWLKASSDYRKESHWLQAQFVLSRRDKRVLIVGPGRAHRLAPVTEALERFLRESGFMPETLDGDLLPEEHRDAARQYELIVALPITVGASAEVLDFLNDEELAERVVVVLPEAYRDGYFARVIEHDHEVRIRGCGVIGEDPATADADVGKKALMALARRLSMLDNAERAREATELIPGPSNVQARMSQGEPPAVPSPTPWRSGSFYLVAFLLIVVAAVVSAVVLGLLAIGVLVLGVLALIAMGALQLRQDEHLSDESFLKLMIVFVQNLGKLRSGGPAPPPPARDADARADTAHRTLTDTQVSDRVAPDPAAPHPEEPQEERPNP